MIETSAWHPYASLAILSRTSSVTTADQASSKIWFASVWRTTTTAVSPDAWIMAFALHFFVSVLRSTRETIVKDANRTISCIQTAFHKTKPIRSVGMGCGSTTNASVIWISKENVANFVLQAAVFRLIC